MAARREARGAKRNVLDPKGSGALLQQKQKEGDFSGNTELIRLNPYRAQEQTLPNSVREFS